MTVGNLNLPFTHPPPAPRPQPATHISTFPRTRHHTPPTMAELDLDLDKILETTETIVQELLATGEFG